VIGGRELASGDSGDEPVTCHSGSVTMEPQESFYYSRQNHGSWQRIPSLSFSFSQSQASFFLDWPHCPDPGPCCLEPVMVAQRGHLRRSTYSIACGLAGLLLLPLPLKKTGPRDVRPESWTVTVMLMDALLWWMLGCKGTVEY
jgi:hypothetical protein